MYYYEEMVNLGADGIDFFSFTPVFAQNSLGNYKIIKSYTKEQFEFIKIIPKTLYRFWKIIDGKKVYLE